MKLFHLILFVLYLATMLYFHVVIGAHKRLDRRMDFFRHVLSRHLSFPEDISVRAVVILCSMEDEDEGVDCHSYSDLFLPDPQVPFSIWTGLGNGSSQAQGQVTASSQTLYLVLSPGVLFERLAVIANSERNIWYIPQAMGALVPDHLLRLGSLVQLYGDREPVEIRELYAVKRVPRQLRRGVWTSQGWVPRECSPKTRRFYFIYTCLLYTSPSPRDRQKSRMPSSA